MIIFDNVVKRYPNGVYGLRGISFEIYEGEFVFLMGASGAGKSTIIKLLMKEENPTCGTIIANNHNLKKVKGRRIPQYRRDLGVVFQDFRLLEKKTVYGNVAFAMEIMGYSPSEIKHRVKLALQLVGLSSKEKEYPSHLSGGEQQRVALARAIVNAPKIIIADEPTGNLDPENSKEIMEILNQINKRGTTVIVATHERDLALSMGKRIVYLDHGLQADDRILCEEEMKVGSITGRKQRGLRKGGGSDEESKDIFIHN
ncbi:MAG: cell division ATP-binding protein FtsE [Clostridiaceae bacterium]|nr:cell division ATP-binding protein FtsE [Clostridiaceae bacterium]